MRVVVATDAEAEGQEEEMQRARHASKEALRESEVTAAAPVTRSGTGTMF